MFKKLLITILVIGVLAIIVRMLINPVVVKNLAISPALSEGQTALVIRAERLAGQPLKRFELVAVLPPFVDGRAYEPDDSAGALVADWTGIPTGPYPILEIRRVIALPGETVVARKGLGIFVDGKLLDESSYTKEKPDCDLFVLADITRRSAESGFLQSFQNNDAPIVVPPDMVFVMADNRQFPGSDKWGFLSQRRVTGRVAYKLTDSGIEELKTPALVFATEKIAINDDGVRALDKGEFSKAIHLFKSALAIDTNFELARDNLSIAYNNFAIASKDNPEVALDSLHKALFLDPDNELTKKNLAGILKRMGKSESNYKDRVDLAEQAEKQGKNISALVEYRALVKLNPNPAILAKVSALEAKCDFPPHAIPEDLVTEDGAQVAQKQAPETQNETRAEETIEQLPKGTSDKPKPETEGEPKSIIAKSESPSASSAKKEKKKTKKEEFRMIPVAEVLAEEANTGHAKSADIVTEQDIHEHKAPPVGKKQELLSATHKKTALKSESSKEKPADIESVRKTRSGQTSKEKKIASKPGPQEGGTSRTKMADLEAPGDTIDESIVPVRQQNQDLAPAVRKSQNHQGFDIGAFMHGVWSALSPDKNERSAGTTDGTGYYRGPPLLNTK